MSLVHDVTVLTIGFTGGICVGLTDWKRMNLRAMWRQRSHWLKWDKMLPAVVIVSALLSGVAAVSSNETAERSRATAEHLEHVVNQLRVCFLEMQDVLQTQSKLSQASDRFALDVSEAAVIRDKIQSDPPPEIEPLSVDDPRRQAWFHQAQINYWQTVDPINIKREVTLAKRAAKKYPGPLCGQIG